MSRKSGTVSRSKERLDDSFDVDIKNGVKKKNDEDAAKDEKKIRRLLSTKEAPEYLTHNPYILSGYRGCKTKKMCLQSIFWWTNETINIWSHLLGFVFLFVLTIWDLAVVDIPISFSDKAIAVTASGSFQICMLLSATYHTFSCKSAQCFNTLLAVDILGIAFALLMIYLTGVYFAFFCYKDLQVFYLVTVALIFVFVMILMIPKYNISSQVKEAVFVGWAAYGIVPTIHGMYAMGLEHPMVQQLFPRIIGMYAIAASAFFFFAAKIPERFFPGSVDYIGSSHQIWHLLIFCAFYYWYNTYRAYVYYKDEYGCVYLT